MTEVVEQIQEEQQVIELSLEQLAGVGGGSLTIAAE